MSLPSNSASTAQSVFSNIDEGKIEACFEKYGDLLSDIATANGVTVPQMLSEAIVDGHYTLDKIASCIENYSEKSSVNVNKVGALLEDLKGIKDTVKDVTEEAPVDQESEPSEPRDSSDSSIALEPDIKEEPGYTEADYKAAMEKYQERNSVLTFRNTFTAYSKCEVDIIAYKNGWPGADGRPVSGATIAIDVLRFLQSNLIESVFEKALCEYLDKRFPAKTDAVDRDKKDFDTEDTDSSLRIYP